MTTPYPLNSKDKKDLEVYIKQFCFKSIQTIVCSRHGSSISSDSSSRSPSWFNVAMADNPGVSEQCKQKISVSDLFHGKTISLTVQLHTPENEVMTLEIWTFSLERKYEQVKVTFTVYNGLCLLLRSMIVASRATPTYRLTRKQTTGGFFCVTYEICSDEPRVNELGDSVKSERIGVVGTPSGTMTASVFYRTTLEIPSSPSSPRSPEQAVFAGDDHHLDYTESGESDSLPFCPFADTTLPALSDLTTSHIAEDKETPFASLLESAFPFSQTVSLALSQVSEESTVAEVRAEMGSPRGRRITSSPRDSVGSPRSPLTSSTAGPTPTPGLFGSPRIQELQRGDVMTSDSFVLIAPFASNSPEDVGSFFRDCASIPKLKLFSESGSGSCGINPASVEQDVREIEDFLNDLSIDELSS